MADGDKVVKLFGYSVTSQRGPMKVKGGEEEVWIITAGKGEFARILPKLREADIGFSADQEAGNFYIKDGSYAQLLQTPGAVEIRKAQKGGLTRRTGKIKAVEAKTPEEDNSPKRATIYGFQTTIRRGNFEGKEEQGWVLSFARDAEFSRVFGRLRDGGVSFAGDREKKEIFLNDESYLGLLSKNEIKVRKQAKGGLTRRFDSRDPSSGHSR